MDIGVALTETYLRLNDYLTMTEFQVQRRSPDGRFTPATDIDIIAVRLPYATEHVVAGGREDAADWGGVRIPPDDALDIEDGMIDAIVGEVKQGHGSLNENFTSPAVLHSVLERVGMCRESAVDDVVAQLVEQGEATWDDGTTRGRCRLALFHGRSIEEPLRVPVMTMSLGHMIRFIGSWLEDYRDEFWSAEFDDLLLDFMHLLSKMGARVEFDGPVRD